MTYLMLWQGNNRRSKQEVYQGSTHTSMQPGPCTILISQPLRFEVRRHVRCRIFELGDMVRYLTDDAQELARRITSYRT